MFLEYGKYPASGSCIPRGEAYIQILSGGYIFPIQQNIIG